MNKDQFQQPDDDIDQFQQLDDDIAASCMGCLAAVFVVAMLIVICAGIYLIFIH